MPITLALRRHEDLTRKGSLCHLLGSSATLVIVSRNTRKPKDRNKQNKPKPKTNQPKEQKFKSKPSKGGVENVCFTVYTPRKELEINSTHEKT